MDNLTVRFIKDGVPLTSTEVPNEEVVVMPVPEDKWSTYTNRRWAEACGPNCACEGSPE